MGALQWSVFLKNIYTGFPGFSGADMANLCREAALYPVRDAATSIEHISLDEVKKRRGCKGRRRGFREGGGALQREEGFAEGGGALQREEGRGRRGFAEGGGALQREEGLCRGRGFAEGGGALQREED